MNHAQINALYVYHFMDGYSRSKTGQWFEVKEDYQYFIDFLGDNSPVIKKGQRIQFQYMTLTGWLFKIEPPTTFLGANEVTFGRSRLLKLKVKEISIESDSLRSTGQSGDGSGGGEEEADETCPVGKPRGISPNIHGGLAEDLDPEMRDILKHRKRST